jgi:hypothetical protein
VLCCGDEWPRVVYDLDNCGQSPQFRTLFTLCFLGGYERCIQCFIVIVTGYSGNIFPTGKHTVGQIYPICSNTLPRYSPPTLNCFFLLHKVILDFSCNLGHSSNCNQRSKRLSSVGSNKNVCGWNS